MKDALALLDTFARFLVAAFALWGMVLAIYQFYSGGDWHFWAFIALWSALISEDRA